MGTFTKYKVGIISIWVRGLIREHARHGFNFLKNYKVMYIFITQFNNVTI